MKSDEIYRQKPINKQNYGFSQKLILYICTQTINTSHYGTEKDRTYNIASDCFGTIAIIGVLARQTVLHYGWDEFSSYLILVVCSIVIGAIYLNLQIAFRQLLSPTIERCFMRFESYRNKTVVAEIPIEHHEVIESAADIESIVSESEIENETPSDTTEEVSTLSLSESNEDSTELPKNEATSSIINNTPIEESSQPTEYEIYHATAMAEKERASQKN